MDIRDLFDLKKQRSPKEAFLFYCAYAAAFFVLAAVTDGLMNAGL